jgi:pimeloyl-ACP methyl ester carboxylesterase
VPQTNYAKNGDVHIAYQVVGEGAVDLVLVPGIFTHLEWQWEEPSYARFLNDLAAFSRLILFDPRGLGLSDRTGRLPTLEQQIDDVTAVLDAVGSSSAFVLGVSQGGPMAVLFVASHPERARGLILYASYPTARADGDFPFGRSREWLAEYVRQLDSEWGTGAFASQLAPSRADDDSFRAWWSKLERLAAGPGNAIAYHRMNLQVDVRLILSATTTPTLVLHRRGDTYRDPRIARYMAERMPAARLVELAGIDHLPYVGDTGSIVRSIQEFVTGVAPRDSAGPDRVLATIVFIDIVGSTETAAAMGDARWRALQERFFALTRRELEQHRGHEIDTAGDSVLARFDGPARAIRYALAVRDGVAQIDMAIRAGLHTGELTLTDEGVQGIAVHLGARVAAAAQPNEVWTSRTVRDLVAGSGIEFRERGAHPLKGLDGEWELFAAEEAAPS